MDHSEKQENERRIWKKRIDDFHASGMTVTQFCKVNDLSPHQIYYWKSKFAEKAEIPVTSKHEQKSPLIKVMAMPEEKPAKMPDPKWVARLIKELYEIT